VRIAGEQRRTIEPAEGGVSILDQTRLPFAVERIVLRTAADAAHAIRTMQVRGAPLIGVTAAYGIALAMKDDPSDASLDRAYAMLHETRPTAINLRWALDRMKRVLAPRDGRARRAWEEAGAIAEDDVATCRAIGGAGLPLLREIAEKKGTVHVLTHCNAGWLATVDYGTALSPIYLAHDAGLRVHVWVSETRPRNQGASLTAWELGAHGVPHTLVADNACGHLLSKGMVDLVIVGADRVTSRGDVANKIGTYLKALAAKEAGVPFYVAFPYSTIDWTIEDGARIPIEERSEDEVTKLGDVRIAPEGTRAYNPAFDVTPARFVTKLITERGTCPATSEGLRALYAR
jgi:methylthioribose-1-phosphate isomerase